MEDPRTALALSPSQLPAHFDSLARPSQYDLDTKTARSRVKLALYNWALVADGEPSAGPSTAFLPEPTSLDSLDDRWTLSAAQAAKNGDGTRNFGDEYAPSRRGKPCGHVFKPGESVYRCRDCGVDPTCVLCARCFHGSRHVELGHDITTTTHAGVGAGCCDCGDVEAWKEGCQRDCRYHGELSPEEQREAAVNDKGKGRAEDQDREERVAVATARVRQTLVGALDWALDALERSPAKLDLPRRVEEITGVVVESPPAPEADEDDGTGQARREAPRGTSGLGGMTAATVAQMLRETAAMHPAMPAAELDGEGGVVDPLEAQLPPALVDILRNVDAAAGEDPDADFEEVLALPGGFPAESEPAAPSGQPLPPPTSGPFATVLWNDERHSFDQVISQVSRATGCSNKAASDIAVKVDRQGRAIIRVSESAQDCLTAAKVVKQIGLVTTVRSALETFREQVAVEICTSYVQDLLKVNVAGEAGGLATMVAQVWLERGADGEQSRFQRWICLEDRLWKVARKVGQEVAVGLLNIGSEVRAELSAQFAERYTHLAESYILRDREPENSLIFLGVQLFTTPSVATLLATEHNLIALILEILFALFTVQVEPSSTKPEHFVLPPSLTKTSVPLNWALTAKQKRFFQLFNDLEHLLSSPGVQRHVAASPQLFDRFTQFLGLFTGINPQKRAAEVHVEFESEQWVPAFNMMTHVARLARCFGAAFAQADALRYARVLSAALAKIPSLGSKYEFQHLKVGNHFYPCIDYDISQDFVSFHHPLAWFWAELAKHAVGNKLSQEALEAIGIGGGMKELLLGELPTSAAGATQGTAWFLAAMEAPVHTVSLVSQVRAGMWVRNGFSMKAQHLHYRDFSLRETAYEQDLFFLQTALVVVDPSIVVTALIDRFGLGELLFQRTIPTDAPFEPEQGLALLEELLSTVTVLVSDPNFVAPLAPVDTLRRELLHFLALAPSTYSDLIGRVSDRFTDDPAIDRILGQIARFKPPSGSNDQGMYSLLDDLVGEVDPNFRHYTRNQRAEAEALVKAWMKRRTGAATPSEELVIVPPKLPVSPALSGPFAELPAAFESHGLQALLVASLLAGRGVTVDLPEGADVDPMVVTSEAVVERALQLCLLAHVESSEAFAAFCLERWPLGADEVTVARLLVEIEEDEQMKSARPKARYLLDRLVEVYGDVVAYLRKPTSSAAEEVDTSSSEKALESKRAAAKARQAAIMQQFQKAQSAFLQSVEAEDDGASDDDAEAAYDEDQTMAGTGACTSTSGAPLIDFGTCIVCQEALKTSASFGLLGFVQTSRFLRLTPDDGGELRQSATPYVQEVLDLPASLDRDMSADRPYGTAKTKASERNDREDGLADGFPLSTKAGLHASSCGHMMHLSCFEQYSSSAAQRHNSQPQRQHPEDTERREFICPLCKSLGNVLLPVECDSTAFSPYTGGFDSRPLAGWGQADADPLVPGPLDRSDADFERRVDKLSTVSSVDDPTAAFRPWLAQASLLTLLPEHFDEAEGRMTGRLLQVVASLADEIHLTKPTLPSDLMGYTVSTLEVASRGTADPVWEIPQSSVHLFQSLTQVLRDLAELVTQSNEPMRVAATSLRQRLGGEFSRGTKYDRLMSLQVDPLGQVLESAICAPSAFYHVAAVAFYTHLISCLVAYYRAACRIRTFPHADSGAASPEGEAAEQATLAQLRGVFAGRIAPGWSETEEPPTFFWRMFDEEDPAISAGLGKHLHAQMTVFLRRVAIVARVTLGSPSDDFTDSYAEDERTEYARLLELLRIPQPDRVLAGLVTQPAALGDDVDTLGRHILSLRSRLWAFTRPADELLRRQEVSLSTFFSSHWPELYAEHPAPYELLGLPKHLDTLLAEVLERECEQCGQVPSNPALCLFCGEMVCAQMFCCMTGDGDEVRGECNEHMWSCGWSVGMYYLVKRNVILVLYADRGSFITPPYLDVHGEAQSNDRRGRSQFPQFLHRQRYDELRKIWLSQGIPTYIARKLESVTDHGGWGTF